MMYVTCKVLQWGGIELHVHASRQSDRLTAYAARPRIWGLCIAILLNLQASIHSQKHELNFTNMSHRTSETFKQVCVQLPTYPESAALPTFAAAASAAVAPAVQQSIDISCSPGPQQQTRRTLLHAGQTDGRRDGWTAFHRPSFSYYAESANSGT